MLKKLLLHIKPEEWLALSFVFVFLGINVLVYQYELSVKQALHLMAKYFTFGDPIYGVFFAFVWLFFFGRLYFFLVDLLKQKIFNRQPFSFDDFKKVVYLSGSHFRTFIPLILVPIASYQFLTSISFQLRLSALDPMFFSWDEKIFGGQAFLFLPSFFTDPVFTRLFSVAYSSLPIAISLTMIALYIKSPNNLFRKMIVAYIVSIMIGMLFFYNFPCQDPNNYFLKNIRHYSFSPEVSAQINQYSPNQLTKETTQRISDSETQEEADNTVPVSCFPSMHATWSLLAVFFIALLWRPSLFMTVPWILLLLTGGLYFAQHYAVDYLVAIPIALVSIGAGWALIGLKKSSIPLSENV